MLRIVGILVAVPLIVIGLAVVMLSPPARGEVAGRYTFQGDDSYCADYPNHACICAHHALPSGTLIRIRRIGRDVVCRVTGAGTDMASGVDFGLNASAARRLGLVDAPAHVRIERLGRLE